MRHGLLDSDQSNAGGEMKKTIREQVVETLAKAGPMTVPELSVAMGIGYLGSALLTLLDRGDVHVSGKKGALRIWAAGPGKERRGPGYYAAEKSATTAQPRTIDKLSGDYVPPKWEPVRPMANQHLQWKSKYTPDIALSNRGS